MSALDLSDANFEVEVSSIRDAYADSSDRENYSTWTATLFGYDSDRDAGVRVGVANLVLFRDARWDTNFYDRMDEVDTDMEQIASALHGPDWAADEDLFELLGVELCGDLVIVDRVGIESEYRGQQLSHLLVNAAAQALSPDGVIALLPMPAGPQKPENIAGLQRHWAGAGFNEFRDGVYVRPASPSGV
jgi:GNAT superfamily N-acetyltransferase